MFSKLGFKFSGQESVPGRGEHDLHFNCDIVNLFLKANGGETKGLIFLFGVL